MAAECSTCASFPVYVAASSAGRKGAAGAPTSPHVIHLINLFALLGPAHTLRGHTELVQLLQQFTLTPDLHRSCTLLNSLFKVSHVSRCSCPSVIRSWADLWLLDRTADVAW
jgi:hypothetical protein